MLVVEISMIPVTENILGMDVELYLLFAIILMILCQSQHSCWDLDLCCH